MHTGEDTTPGSHSQDASQQLDEYPVLKVPQADESPIGRKLSVCLLGGLRIASGDQQFTQFEASSARALFAYLAAEFPAAPTRSFLSALLWPQTAEATALTNLRSAIRRVRAALEDSDGLLPAVVATRDGVHLNAAVEWQIDLLEFKALVQAADAHAQVHEKSAVCPLCMENLRRAAALYTGPFLADLHLESDQFEQWRWEQEEQWRRTAVHVLYQLSDSYFRLGQFGEAEHTTRRQLALEPWNEEAHRQLMNILFAGGQRSAALAQYEICRQILAHDLNAVPSEETDALYNQLQAGGSAVKAGELTNPYRGLHAFTNQDGNLFFGRTAMIRRLHEAIERQPVTVLVGLSGSGKSSLIHAGLCAKLARQTLPPGEDGAQTDWRISVLRPGQDAHPEATAARRQLVVFDQFEEIFSLYADPIDRSEAIGTLLGKLAEPVAGNYAAILIALRSNFMDRALGEPLIADAVREHALMLAPMTRGELERAVIEPARLQGISFEPGLVDRLLDDVGSEAGQLPLLQYVLTHLWQYRDGDWITHAAYEKIGGARGTISRYADGVYAQLPPDEQRKARRIFLTLMYPANDTQERQYMATRAQLGEDLWPLAQKLADDRLLVTDRGPDGDEIVELAHVALVREWRQLRAWLETDREFQTWLLRMRHASDHWRHSSYDDSALLQTNRLSDAESWLVERGKDIDESIRRYIEASVALRERRTQAELEQQQREVISLHAIVDAERRRAEAEATARSRLRRLTRWLTAAAVVAVSAAAIALWALSVANDQRREAEANAQLALARQLSAQATNATGSDLDLALLLGVEALRLEPNREEVVNLLTEFNLEPQLSTILHGPPSPLYSLGMGPHGEVLGSNEQGSVLSWNLADGQLKSVSSAPEGQVWAAAVSPRGDRYVTVNGAQIVLWDAATHKQVAELNRHTADINTLAFTADGSRLVTAGADNQVFLWNAQDGAFIATLMDGLQRSLIGPVSLDGRVLLLGDGPDTAENALNLYDATRGEVIGSTMTGHTDLIHGYAVSPDGEQVATASFDGTVRVWNTQTGAPEGAPLAGHSGRVLFVTYSPDGKTLATGGTDGKVILWDAATHQPIGVPLVGHNQWVRSGHFSPDGQTLVTGDETGRVFVWDMDSWHRLDGHTDRVRSLAVSPDGRTLVTSGFDRKLNIWDAATLQLLHSIDTAHENSIIRVAFSPDGSSFVSADAAGRLLLWDPTTWTPKFPILQDDNHGAVVIGLAFSPDGKRLATGGFDGFVQVWDVESGTLTGPSIPAFEGWALSVLFSPDGSKLIAGGADGTIRVFDAKTGQPIGKPMTGHTNWVTDLVYTPDGSQLVSASADGTIRVWDAATWQPVGAPITGHNSQVWSLFFDTDKGAPILISLGGDGKIFRWDWEKRQPLGPALQTYRETEEMDIAPGAQRLYVASFISETLVIDTPGVGWPQAACAIANRNLSVEEWQQYLHEEPYTQTCPP